MYLCTDLRGFPTHSELGNLIISALCNCVGAQPACGASPADSGRALCLESSALGLSPTWLFFQYALLSDPMIHLILCAMDTYFGYLSKVTFDTHISHYNY